AFPDLSQAVSEVERDPLGSVAMIGRIEEAIIRWRTELQALETERQSILASIAHGKTAMADLQDLLVRSADTLAEARKAIANPEELAPLCEEGDITSLNGWLSTLEQNAAAGRFAAVKIGMVKWESAYNNQLSAARASFSHNRAVLDEKDDLRGRFK